MYILSTQIFSKRDMGVDIGMNSWEKERVYYVILLMLCTYYTWVYVKDMLCYFSHINTGLPLADRQMGRFLSLSVDPYDLAS